MARLELTENNGLSDINLKSPEEFVKEKGARDKEAAEAEAKRRAREEKRRIRLEKEKAANRAKTIKVYIFTQVSQVRYN